MDTERKIELFGVLAVLLFGSVLGGFTVYQTMDDRVSSLEHKVSNLQDQQQVVYINGTKDEKALVSLYQQVEGSTVSIDAIGNQVSQGSGFVYNKEGYIVTNQHVIDGADSIDVIFSDGTRKKAEVVGSDVYNDLAVLKVNKQNLKPLPLANSTEVMRGQTAVAIGNPFGLSGTMTAGIVSAKNRNIRTEGGFSIPNVIQTDAAINPGNSGGPLINIHGKVIGVNTAIQSSTGTFNGVGFAIPSNTVKRVVPDLIENGERQHSWIGVSGLDVNSDISEAMNLSTSTGFLVMDVVEDSPAEKAGLQAGTRNETINGITYTLGGDVITAINGTEMTGISDILTYLAEETEPGDEVTITVIRDGEEVEVPVTLASRPQD
ncbi:S1C family serine protease [Candidatus Nanohalovita haloferacivicina]|uniref:S1C family serine protease n=1 Tax=Candidatus Nanohalovita haloferacivicina TaxID=2978046 RepID=UPI00325FBE5D|nr:Serine protease Do [Candidatus Nanohalobia archaeon BNXNv]